MASKKLVPKKASRLAPVRQSRVRTKLTESTYEIKSNNAIVWVNGPWCLGRYGLRGAEVYFEGSQTQLDSKTPEDWKLWVSEMRRVHGVEVPKSYMPARCKNGKA